MIDQGNGLTRREEKDVKRGRRIIREKVSLKLPRMRKNLKKEIEQEEKALLFVDLLAQVETKREENGVKNPWLDVSRRMKKELMGSKYAHVLRFLKEKGIIEVYLNPEKKNEYYRPGGRQKQSDGSR
jgi:hypothetical protein